MFLIAMGAGVSLRGPVPLNPGDDTLAVVVVTLALGALCAVSIWRLLPDWQDGPIAGFTALVLLSILAATALPDLLHAANAMQVRPGSNHTQVERFAALKEAHPAKRRSAYWLRSLPIAPPNAGPMLARDRHVSRAAHAALQAERLIPGELLRIDEATGALGWPFVVSVARLRAATELARAGRFTDPAAAQ